MRLVWLTEAYCRLFLQDSVLRPHMQPILETLYSNMQAFAKSSAAAAVQPATLRLAMHVVNGLLAELRH